MKTILLVEDNFSHVRLIQEAWKEIADDHQIIPVKDGIEALSYLRQEGIYTHVLPPQIILLDLNLPRKDGREVLAEVKSDRQLRKIPVIVLTTSTNEEDINKSYELYANCYITKPRNLKDLFKVIRLIVEFWLDTVTLTHI